MRLHKATFCFLTLVSVLVFSFVPLVQNQEVNGGSITFQPNSIPEVDVYYDDFSFVFEYKSFFIRIRPFVIYNGQYYNIKQIIQWIKNNYPNVNYKWLVDKATNAIHYGYNLTNLPQNVANKIDFLGFKLIDYNFPLSWFELEAVEFLDDRELPYNVTMIHIPRANLVFSFEDLYPLGYSVQHINSTYILIGEVKGKTDLIVDPITISSNIITAIGGTEGSELDFEDLWDADKGGTLELLAKIQAGNHTLTTQVKPTDNKSITLDVIASELTVSGWANITGTEKDDSTQTENISISANQTYTTSEYWKTITYINCSGTWNITIQQNQWGAVWKQSDTQYTFDAKLVFGNYTVAGTTYFTDIEKQITFTSLAITGNSQRLMYPMGYSHVIFGELVNATTKTTRKGCSFIWLNSDDRSYCQFIRPQNTNAETNVYSCYFVCNSTYYGCDAGLTLHGNLYNTIGSRVYLGGSLQSGQGIVDVYNFHTSDARYGVGYGMTGTFDTVEIFGAWRAIYFYSSFDTTFQNVKVIKGSSSSVYSYAITHDKYLINPDIDVWSVGWGGTSTHAVCRQYEFDLTIFFKNGTQAENANVTISNDYLGTSDSWLTYTNGSILTQTYSMGHYNQTGGNTIYDYNPYNLTVTLDGYETYTDIINITQQEDLRIALTETPQPAPSTVLAVAGFAFTMFTVATAIFIIRRKKQSLEA